MKHTALFLSIFLLYSLQAADAQEQVDGLADTAKSKTEQSSFLDTQPGKLNLNNFLERKAFLQKEEQAFQRKKCCITVACCPCIVGLCITRSIGHCCRCMFGCEKN